MFSGTCGALQGTALQPGPAEDGLAGGSEEPQRPWGRGTHVALPCRALPAVLFAPHLVILSFRQLLWVHWLGFSNAPLEQRVPCVMEKCQLCLLRFLLNPGWAHMGLETFSAPWDPS